MRRAATTAALSPSTALPPSLLALLPDNPALTQIIFTRTVPAHYWIDKACIHDAMLIHMYILGRAQIPNQHTTNSSICLQFARYTRECCIAQQLGLPLIRDAPLHCTLGTLLHGVFTGPWSIGEQRSGECCGTRATVRNYCFHTHSPHGQLIQRESWKAGRLLPVHGMRSTTSEASECGHLHQEQRALPPSWL